MAKKTSPKGRPRLGVRGHGRHTPQHRLNAETVGKKLVALALLDSTSNMRATILHFYPTISPAAHKSKRTQIYSWKRAEQKLQEAARTHRGGQHKLREKEDELVRFANELREEGMPVSSLMLAMKAREIAADAGIESIGPSGFWMDGFKFRQKMSVRAPTRQAQVSPADLDSIATEFATRVQGVTEQLGIQRVYNADLPGLICLFLYIPKKTLSKKGEKTVWVKCGGVPKNRATVMLLGDSGGKRYSPFVIFETPPSKDPAMHATNTKMRCRFGKKVWSEVKALCEEYEMEIHGNSKGWWNGGLSVEFLNFHFADRSSPHEPVLLLWDDFSGPVTTEVRQCSELLKVVLLKVPPHATSVSQPADVAWNFPFKMNLRHCWLTNLRVQVTEHWSKADSFRLIPPKCSTISRWISDAWGQLSVEIIANGYRKCDLLPSEECVAVSALILALESLHVIGGNEINPDDEYDCVADVMESRV